MDSSVPSRLSMPSRLRLLGQQALPQAANFKSLADVFCRAPVVELVCSLNGVIDRLEAPDVVQQSRSAAPLPPTPPYLRTMSLETVGARIGEVMLSFEGTTAPELLPQLKVAAAGC